MIYFSEFQYTGNDFFYDLQMAFVATAAVISALFIFFCLGQIFHSKLADLSDQIYQTEWNQYPRNVQRFIQLIL